MANICETTFKLRFDDEARALEMLDTLKQLDENGWHISLCDLAKHYGIDYEKEHIYVRGNVCFYDLDDVCQILTIDVESAWAPTTDLFDTINEKLGDCFSVNYRSIESGCELYEVRDNYNLFPEECLLDCNGDPFEEKYEFGSICDAISYWCEKMNIQRNGRTDKQMLEIIEDYEYSSEDTYFYIRPFEFM